MDIQEIVQIHGIENIRVTMMAAPLNFVPIIGLTYTSSNDEEFEIETSIKEDRYTIEDGYKIEFNAVSKNGKHFSPHAMYQSDFNSNCESGHIKVTVNIQDNIA